MAGSLNASHPHVVIIGGGFAGLNVAKGLGNKPFRVTLIDRRNFHLFQPLLYQVATGQLSIGQIASPLRVILNKYQNVDVVMDSVQSIDTANKQLMMSKQLLDYDILVVAAGSKSSYFGHDDWEAHAPTLKTLENALDIRQRIFSAFERAEFEPDPVERERLLTFVIIGGGPTGVEMAGALGELVLYSVTRNFHHIDPKSVKITMLEGAPNILLGYPEALSKKAHASLEDLGVKVMTNSAVTNIANKAVYCKQNDTEVCFNAETILWTAGVTSSGLAAPMAQALGVELDRRGRVKVGPDLSVPGHPELFVIGDLCYIENSKQQPLPGVATVAIQEGCHVAQVIQARAQNKPSPAFQFVDKGTMAVIGRNNAVADLKFVQLSGFLGWLVWAVIHIWYLTGLENRFLVVSQWLWWHLTRQQSAQLITHTE